MLKKLITTPKPKNQGSTRPLGKFGNVSENPGQKLGNVIILLVCTEVMSEMIILAIIGSDFDFKAGNFYFSVKQLLRKFPILRKNAMVVKFILTRSS